MSEETNFDGVSEEEQQSFIKNLGSVIMEGSKLLVKEGMRKIMEPPKKEEAEDDEV